MNSHIYQNRQHCTSSCSTKNRAYQAAIVLNNTAISLLRQRKYKDSIETFRDGLKIMRYSFVTRSSSSSSSNDTNNNDTFASHRHDGTSFTSRRNSVHKIVASNDTSNNFESSSSQTNRTNEDETIAINNDDDDDYVNSIISNSLHVASERLARQLLTTYVDVAAIGYFGKSSSLDAVTTLFFDHTPDSLINPAMDTDVLGLRKIFGVAEKEQDDDEDKDDGEDASTNSENTDVVAVNEESKSAKASYYLIHIDDVDDDLLDVTTSCHWCELQSEDYFYIKSRTLDTSILLNNYGVAFGIYYDDYCRRHPNEVAATTSQECSSVSTDAIGELLRHSDQFFQLAYSTLDDELCTYRDDDCDMNQNEVSFTCFSTYDCDGLHRTTMLLTSLVLQNLMHVSFRLNEHNNMMMFSRCSRNKLTTTTTATTTLSSSQHSIESSTTSMLNECNERSDSIFEYYCEISRIQSEYTNLDRLVEQRRQQCHIIAFGTNTFSRSSDVARAA